MRRQADTLNWNTQSASTLDELRTEWSPEEERASSPFTGILFGLLFAMPFWSLLAAAVMWVRR